MLTDGRLWLTADGEEQKTFHVHDGQGIALLHRAGLKTGVISGRTSAAVERRGRELGMSYLWQSANDKSKAFDEIIAEAGVSPHECAYIGDDVADVSVMRRAGLAVAVADAVDEARQAAHYVTRLAGGRGAVREVCELILNARGR